MAAILDATDVKVQVREVGDTEWKVMTCEVDEQSELTNDTTETDTKCGTFFGTKEAKGNISGNAVYNVSPEADEVTLTDVRNWQRNKTNLEMLIENEAFVTSEGDSIAEGAALHEFWTGKFVGSTRTGAVGDVIKFSWTFKPQGLPILSGSSS